MTVSISIKNLGKSFGNKRVLQGVNLEIARGENLAIIGGSGSGKSVLLKTIIGLQIPDRGSSVIIDGKDVTYLPITQRSDLLHNLGMLFQAGALFDSLSVWQNICFSLLQSNSITVEAAKQHAAEKLQSVGLPPAVCDLYPAELSGGMQKRVALARAIAADPQLILFDEPTAGLDPVNSSMISSLIRDLSKKLRATTITITHDMNCVNTVADSVAMVHNSTIIWHNDAKLLNHSGNIVVDNFINGRHEGNPL